MEETKSEVINEILDNFTSKRSRESAKKSLELLTDEQFSSLAKNWNSVKKYCSSKEHLESVKRLRVEERINKASEIAKRIISKKQYVSKIQTNNQD